MQDVIYTHCYLSFSHEGDVSETNSDGWPLIEVKRKAKRDSRDNVTSEIT